MLQIVLLLVVDTRCSVYQS